MLRSLAHSAWQFGLLPTLTQYVVPSQERLPTRLFLRQTGGLWSHITLAASCTRQKEDIKGTVVFDDGYFRDPSNVEHGFREQWSGLVSWAFSCGPTRGLALYSLCMRNFGHIAAAVLLVLSFLWAVFPSSDGEAFSEGGWDVW